MIRQTLAFPTNVVACGVGTGEQEKAIGVRLLKRLIPEDFAFNETGKGVEILVKVCPELLQHARRRLMFAA